MSPSSPLSLHDLPSRDGLSVGQLPPQSPGISSLAKNTNPLAAKVTTVLSTSYSDTEFRNALALLDDRNVVNDAKTRRQIRLELQKEVIDSNGEIITEFGLVAEQLRRIGSTLAKLNSGYQEMKDQLLAAHGQTSSALDEASSLLEQREQIVTKQELLHAVKDHFIMSDDELAALTSSAEPVDGRFFTALSKAKKINKDCEVLLGFENQTLGSELMEQASKNINQGFQKLYKWVQREFKTLNLENPQLNPSVRHALRVLAERPSLFQNCLDFFAEARERVLTDSFYMALTGNSSGGSEDPSIKPIDMTAHDPLRYVGDMLAWIHSATVSEREALEVLFVAEGEELAKGLKSGRDAEVWRLLGDEEEHQADFNAINALHDLVDRDVSGAARVLRQRVEQVIQSNEEIIPAYNLSNLINFYRVTFQKLLGENANLVECTKGLEMEGLRQFRALIRDRIAMIQGESQQTPSDLGLPGFLQECLKQLGAIARTYDSSLSASDVREREFESVLAEAFEPFMSGLAAATSLEPFDFTANRAKQLQESAHEESEKLTKSQHEFFLEASGLRPLITAIPAARQGQKLERAALSHASQCLDDFLPSALMDAMENLRNLHNSKLAREVTEEAAEMFCEDFERLEELVIGVLDACYHLTFGAMLRNRALTALQKTYDDSYLSCSTAVYYEGQGDETEAMRHWRNALHLIYEHHATSGYSGQFCQTDTEKALFDAVKELELQCKERIDLLEALRMSRQESPRSFPQAESRTTLDSDGSSDMKSKGSIGQGTIPAVSYAQLSRPSLPHRPSLPNRASSEMAVVSGGGSRATLDTLNPEVSPQTPNLPPRPERTARSRSPEKYTMRTTLRKGSKPPRPSRKSPLQTAEGPSKAATLAWGALGSREKSLPVPQVHDNSATSSHSTRNRESARQAGLASMQWDSHSRRLVPPRENDNLANSPSSCTGRHSDEYSYVRPSILSVSAASSALTRSSLQTDATLSDQAPHKNDRGVTTPSNSSSGSHLRPPRGDKPQDTGQRDDSVDAFEKRNASDGPVVKRTSARRQIRSSEAHVADQDLPSPPLQRRRHKARDASVSSLSDANLVEQANSSKPRRRKKSVSNEDDSSQSEEKAGVESSDHRAWKKKKAAILKNLPPGIDESAAKQILNDIVVQGDEVHWGDIAGLEIAKNALRETVVYPFLRPDLFMGLREPARGMLLFGPPGTGKTMLARAVATESKSTFFSISASSLTSKYLGESEKLVKALFGLARVLAPSIIFVDEIDSLLSQRAGSSEHEATRRIKTEFLIQWSDLQRAAAGREVSQRDRERGDANRVLVLAATNLPWAIDEAARRRFVRRQYIPLPEPTTRETQLRTLLGQQTHSLSNSDITQLVNLTAGFSGSDITALAKDAAMGPLRSLGDALLHMTMDDIRPISLADFEASLGTIRPSVSKSGLKQYEDWATEFGERGG
ncbi:Conserved oligomeric Golgi complex subunit [Paramyrothecium foliicola]|nr:Conserved oligomeric Golgi complex subunit [Paramyrothecium foliicola]